MKSLVLIFCSVIVCNVFAQNSRNDDGSGSKSFYDPVIVSMLSNINADSIGSTVLALQNFGTRFMLSPNRKQVAEWIKNKFVSIGYQNTVIDSFLVQKSWNGNTYNLYEYNVVATLQGQLNPELINIVGGHYDSYCQTGDPFTSAPGADDNASGTAAAIEVARVMKATNYQPASTIQFIAFGAEELMMSPGGCGSCYYASQALSNGSKIQLMINNDMISHATTSGGWIVNMNRYDNSAWLSKLASQIIVDYTSLSILNASQMNAWSDSRPFYDAGFNAVYFEEAQFSPYYHMTTDVISNYNLQYCAEITKISCALLKEAIDRPVLQKLEVFPSGGKIHVTWNKKADLNIAGYNVYRSPSPGNNFELVSLDLVNDTAFIDTNVTSLSWYYYKVVSVNNTNQESIATLVDSAIVPTFDQGVLIVDDSQNELLLPADSAVDNFYSNLFSEYTYTNFDAISSTGGINLSLLGKYGTIVWHTDKYSSSAKFYASAQEIGKYIKFGGKFLLTTDKFAATVDHNLAQHDTYSPGSNMYNSFHVDSFYRSVTSRFIQAKSADSAYPDLHIDTLKTPVSNNHHLSNIEAIFPVDGNVIYSYHSNYDSLTSYGNMQGMPVGIEHITNTGKFILLSFPLWYVNYSDAKALIDYVMQEKFNDTSLIYIPQINLNSQNSFFCSPNPVVTEINLSFTLNENQFVDIEMYSVEGVLVDRIFSKMMHAGKHIVTVSAQKFCNGIYSFVLHGKGLKNVTKVVILK